MAAIASSSAPSPFYTTPLRPGLGAVADPLEFNDPSRLRLEDFHTVKVVGTGTFGKVAVVTYKGNGQYYALKSMKKDDIVRLRQVEHVRNEKTILLSSHHPFIVRLFAALQDESYLHLVMEYVPGGELFARLRKVGRFSVEASRFYSAQIVLALAYLHARGVIYRDLKPENILLDARGYLRLCDFGFAKQVEDKTFTLCGTPEYLAPEVIHSKGYGKQVDWWSLGVLMFEMHVGYPPFYDDNPFGIYEKIVAGKVNYPPNLDINAKDLIRKLLVIDKSKRFGCMKSGVQDIKEHKYFQGLDWDALYARRLPTPWVPPISHPGDTNMFGDLEEDLLDTQSTSPGAVKPDYARYFADF